MTVIPGQAPPIVDQANPLLTSGLPAQLQAGLMQLSTGDQAGIATIRTPDCTLTVSFGDRAGVEEWIRVLGTLRDMMPAPGSKLLIAQPGMLRP